MAKRISIVLFLFTFIFFNATTALAIKAPDKCDPTDGDDNHGCDAGLYCQQQKGFDADMGQCKDKIKAPDKCDPTDGDDNHGCDAGLYCQQQKGFDADMGQCKKRNRIQEVFGTVKPPAPLAGFLKNDPTGGSAISQFLSNFIALLFSIAAIVLIFMIIWGAFEWTTSGGDKEKLAGAQKRIIHAIIGIILFGVAFAAIALLGSFTGFKFFKGQGVTILNKYPDGTYQYKCPGDDVRVYSNKQLICP